MGMTYALSAVATFFGDAVGALVPALSSGLMRSLVITVVLLLFSGLNLLGIAAATRFNVVMTIAKLAPLALVIVVGLAHLNADRLALTRTTAAEISRGSVFLIFAFLGIESALVPSGEVKNPSHSMPRAIAIAMVGVVIAYMAIQLVSQSVMGSALGSSKTPVADVGGALMGAGGRNLILIGSTISMFGYVSGMTLAVPRMLFAFARDGFLPSKVSVVNERFRTPHIAIMTQAVITIALALTGQFERLAVIANASILIVYGACALAIFQLRRKNIRLETPPFVAPFGFAIPLLAFLAIAWLMTSVTVSEWLAVGIPIAAALAIYGGRKVMATR
jgi:amino acid transporter